MIIGICFKKKRKTANPEKYSCLIKRKVQMIRFIANELTGELTQVLIYWRQLYVVIWLRYESLRSDISVLKTVQNVQTERFISVIEESDPLENKNEVM